MPGIDLTAPLKAAKKARRMMRLRKLLYGPAGKPAATAYPFCPDCAAYHPLDRDCALWRRLLGGDSQRKRLDKTPANSK